jgi:hypothetical protein
MLSVNYAECRKQAHFAECQYAECLYAECCYAECHGTIWGCTLAAQGGIQVLERLASSRETVGSF